MEYDCNEHANAHKIDKLLSGVSRLEHALHSVSQRIDMLPEVLTDTGKRSTSKSCLIGSNEPDMFKLHLSHADDSVAPSQAVTSSTRQISWNPQNQVEDHEAPASPQHHRNTLRHSLSSVGEGAPASRLSVHDPESVRGSRSTGSPIRYVYSHTGSERKNEELKPIAAHEVFQDLNIALERTDYQQVKEWTDPGGGMGRTGSLASTGTKQGPMVSRVSTQMSLSPQEYLPLHPTCGVRTAFDIVSTLVLGFDAVWVPVIIAWSVPARGAFYAVAWAVAIFWTIDIAMNFSTGYSDGHSVVLYWPRVARHYLRGTFGIDLLIVLLDYAELLASLVTPGGMDATSLQVLKFLRFGKVTRLVRIIAKLRLGLLARVDNMVSYWVHLHGLVGYQPYFSFLGILMKLLAFIAWLSHFGSCLWFFLQRADERDPSWYNQLRDELHFDDYDFYVHGLYWSVSAMFSGASHISPTNSMEFLFSGFYVTMGALFVTSITSSLAVILIEGQEGQQERKKKVRVLTKFMEQTKTPVLLALAIRSAVVERISAEKRLTELDVPFLMNIPPGLRAQLRASQYDMCYRVLPFFRMLSVLHDSLIQDLCFSATTFSVTNAGEELFGMNKVLDHAVVLTKGILQYTDLTIKASPSHVTNHQSRSERVALNMTRSTSNGTTTGLAVSAVLPVEPLAWIAEMALLVRWSTVGVLESECPADVLKIAAESFIKVVQSHPVVAATASAYAVQIAKIFEETDLMFAPTDLDAHVDSDAVTANLHLTIREALSMPVLETVRRNAFMGLLRRKTLFDLEVEVRDGKCHLVIGPNGEICRTVRLAVVRLVNKDGLICVKLAETRYGNCTPKFQLPGRKVDAEEHPEEALETMIADDFRAFAGAMSNDVLETIIEDEDSASFGLRTKYIKTMQTVNFEASIHLEGQDIGRMPGSTPSRIMSSMPSWSRSLGFPTLVTQTSGEIQKQGSGEKALNEGGTSSSTLKGAMKTAFAMPHQEHDIFLYTWMEQTEFERMFSKRVETESALSRWCDRLETHHIRKMGQWRMRREISVPESDLETEENEMESGDEVMFSA